MQGIELSIILPVKNVENEIPGILRSIVRQAEDNEVEFIVVDMGSTDNTVLEALQLIKELKLRGCVVQNGPGNVSAALNTGIHRSTGDYITFIFARRLYQNFIGGYLDTKMKTDADFIFGSFSENSSKSAEMRIVGSRVTKKIQGVEFLKELLKSNIRIDISAIMVRRKTLIEKQIYFYDDCANGYAEEFVFHCLLCMENVMQSPTILIREAVFELNRGKQFQYGAKVFQYVNAMLRIENIIRTDYGSDKELEDLFVNEKLPATVMYCIDVMLREGHVYQSVKEILKSMGFNKLLIYGKSTDKMLKRHMTKWKRLPWLYKAKA